MRIQTKKNIVELEKDKLFLLQNIVELDGRLIAFPPNQTGFAPLNSYIIKEDTGALMIDTGYLYHQDSILYQLSKVITPDLPLSVLPSRVNEFMSVGNAKAISQQFNVIDYYLAQPDAPDWFDFTDGERDLKLKEIPTHVIGKQIKCEIGCKTGRFIEIMSAPLRLINTAWVYDKLSKTLFTSDMFTYALSDNKDGPWILQEDDLRCERQFIKSFMLNTRYWWLEGAKTRLLRENIRRVFNEYDITTIAPGYGKIFRGRELVAKQFSKLDTILAELDFSKIKAQYIARNHLR